ncbi:MAG: RidA family protein [Burkholderiales bacterium]|nr:RidA family protein [Burkholderiales bacterium]
MPVTTLSPSDFFEPIGPYSHLARAGNFITISGTPGIDPATQDFAGTDAYSHSQQIVKNFRTLLAAAGAQLSDVLHVNVYLKHVEDFAEMNRAFAEEFGNHKPARTVICVADLPKKGALMTMDLTAVINESMGSDSIDFPPIHCLPQTDQQKVEQKI